MMGQGTGQRSNLTMNHGSYYLDTTVSAKVQGATGATNLNVFLKDQSYYVYLLYAKASTHQQYSLYIGKNYSEADALAKVTTGLVNPFKGTKPVFIPGTGSTPEWITSKTYDPKTGFITVAIDLAEQESIFEKDLSDSCRPETYCSVHTDGMCGCKPGSNCKHNSVCSWGPKQPDCPVAGCFGFAVKMPSDFDSSKFAKPIATPKPIHFSGDSGSDPYFASGNIVFYNVPEKVSGAQCFYSKPPTGSADDTQ
jgi:cell migration-inducing and hyaluronan-binding protein